MVNWRKLKLFYAIMDARNADKSIIHLPRWVNWIGQQPFAKWGNIWHNEADEFSDTTNLTT